MHDDMMQALWCTIDIGGAGIDAVAPIHIPKQIELVLSMLEGMELPAWLVGGCLRDILMGRAPQDWDFATPFPPDLVREKLIEAQVPVWDTGLKHGTVTFRVNGASYEITTFRRDGPYEDYRRPKWVEFTTSLYEDLARRDFTINAMAWHRSDGLTDPFGGMADMDKRLIRAVGKPEDRLQEDALRILRGIRFAGSLGFDLDEGLAASMRDKIALLAKISPERLASELQAMLMLPSPKRALEMLADTGAWAYLAPEMTAAIGFDQRSSHHYLDVYGHTVQTVEHTPQELMVRLAALFHDVAKPAVFTLDEEGNSHFRQHETVGAEMAKGILDRLRFSHAIRNQVAMLIRYHMLHLRKRNDAGLRRAISEIAKPREENLERILALQKADLSASRHTAQSLEDFALFAQRCKGILHSGCPLDIRDLAVGGWELEELGVPPAKRGSALKAMLAEVIEDPSRNQREVLLELAKAYR